MNRIWLSIGMLRLKYTLRRLGKYAGLDYQNQRGKMWTNEATKYPFIEEVKITEWTFKKAVAQKVVGSWIRRRTFFLPLVFSILVASLNYQWWISLVNM